MNTVADQIDQLTRTFSTDRAYCDALFDSPHASLVAEFLLSHLWANTALPICYQALSDAVPKHFGTQRREKAALWNLILCDGVNSDLRLVPYLVLRGLGSEAAGALRRAFEHVGVLTQMWSFPEKVDALENSRSKQYTRAFRKETDRAGQDALKKRTTSKRFAAMQLGAVATLLYKDLSEFDVHGGTNRRFFVYSTEANQLTCSFCTRLEPSEGNLGIKKLEILANGHRTVCGEMICLAADHAALSEDLIAAAEMFKMFGCVAGEPTAEWKRRVSELLDKLRGPQPTKTQ